MQGVSHGSVSRGAAVNQPGGAGTAFNSTYRL